jgi:peptidoglycan/xylan/chitin deacetylase (PgdA/CDA1 family)
MAFDGFSWSVLGDLHECPGIRTEPFRWPDGKKAAVSLSFDDARLSQVDNGLALFKKEGVKVTFFVQPSGVEKRLAGWKQAVADGHEIGNHSLTHPCTGNYTFHGTMHWRITTWP